MPLLSEEKCRRCASCTGLCADHLRNTCCVLLEVTKRCNMHCSFCFAEADSPESRRRDLNSEQLKARIFDLTIPGKTLLQLSGGEPTVREDLPELISFAIKCGCRYVQLNTNGIRLAEDPDYAKSLAEAGLSFVFLQFDGLDDKIYRKLRGRDLLEIKLSAIENCKKAGLGVTLVPVIVPGVNENAIGEILRFGAAHSPAVRGVHFQPVSYFGRAPHGPEDRDRFTLDELLSAIYAQSEGLVKQGMLGPSCCDHPMCGLHGDFIVMPDKSLYPLTHWTGVQRRQQDETPEKEGQDRTAERGPALPEKGSGGAEPGVHRAPVEASGRGDPGGKWRCTGGVFCRREKNPGYDRYGHLSCPGKKPWVYHHLHEFPGCLESGPGAACKVQSPCIPGWKTGALLRKLFIMTAGGSRQRGLPSRR